ncbi:retrovirus-related pol polyprotein from transposon TNT 1-94, partial [Tanacetum coccineum]
SHFVGECRKPKENKAFIGGAWSDSEDDDEHQNDTTCIMAIDSQEIVSKPSSSNHDLNIIDLQKENEKLLEFNKDFTKKLKKLLNEKRSLENENSILLSKVNDLEFEVCLKYDLLPDDWIVDSGCTKHMTGNRRLFTSYKAYDGGHVVFGSNLKGKVVGEGQLCDDDCVVSFTKVDCTIGKSGKTLAKGHRRNGATLNMRLVHNSASNELVRNPPKLSFERHFCDTCGLGSQGNANNRTRKEVSTTRVLELLHLDLFGPSPIQSYGGNFYTLKIVDYHSNYTWVVFVESKDDVLDKFKILCKKLENLHDCSIVSIVTNHSSEFDKLQFGSFCEQHGMSYNLSGPFTSQSSEIVERTHRKLRKMSRAINRKPSLEYFKVFGCKVFILNTKVHLTKFDPKSYEGVFLGYSQTSKAYIVLNKETMRIEESLNVTFDESLLEPKSSPSIKDDRINKPIVQDLNGSPSLQVNVSDEGYPKSRKKARDHPIKQVIGELNERTLRSKTKQS